MFNHRARTLCDRPVCDLTFSVQASKWVLNVLLTAAGRVGGRTLPPYPLFDLSPIFHLVRASGGHFNTMLRSW